MEDDKTRDPGGFATANRFVSGLRWAAALPGGLAAAIVATFPAHWLLVLLYYLKSLPSGEPFMTREGRPVPFFGIPFETMERAVIAALIPIVFIQVGTLIAPAKKWTAAVILGVLWILLMTVAITWAVSTSRLEVEFTVTTLLVLALNLAGVIYALVTAHNQHGSKTAVADIAD